MVNGICQQRRWSETQKGEEQYQERVTVPVTKTKECADEAKVKATSSKETLWLLLAGPQCKFLPWGLARAVKWICVAQIQLGLGYTFQGSFSHLLAFPVPSQLSVSPGGWEGNVASTSPSPWVCSIRGPSSTGNTNWERSETYSVSRTP